MPGGDGTGPPRESRGPQDGRGGGRGNLARRTNKPGKGPMTGGRKLRKLRKTKTRGNR